jgi:hypothetical protein
MKKNYLLYLLLVSALFPFTLFAQTQSVYVTRGSNAMMLSYFEPVNQTREQWLNPYLYEEWKDGYIIFGDSIMWEGQLRFDMFRKEMEMVLKNDTVLVTDPFSLKIVKMGAHDFVYAFFINERRNRQYFGADYFEVLSKPAEAKLLLRRKLRIDEEQMTSGKVALSIKSDDKTRFAAERHYYIQLTDKTEARRIRLSKRSVMKVLDDHKSELKQFANQNKLSFSRLTDLAKIIDFYNTLN